MTITQSTRFMITCAARTGSTLLQTNLASHPDILMHGEVYPPRQVAALAGNYSSLIKDPALREELTKYRNENQALFLERYVFDPQGHRAVGLKLKHEELLLPQFKDTKDALAADLSVRIIHLRRENLFARFASWWIVNHVTGVTEIHKEEDRPHFDPVIIPVERVARSFDETVARDAEVHHIFEGHTSIETSYERLIGPRAKEEYRRIQEFLGVQPHSLDSPLRRVNQRPLREIIANYDELQARFSGTRHAAYFLE